MPAETRVDAKTDAKRLFEKRAKMMKERDESEVGKTFASVLGERIRCLECKKPMAKFSSELCLSIPLVKRDLPPAAYFQSPSPNLPSEEESKNFDSYFNQTLDQSVTQFLSEETLSDEDQKLYCQSCLKPTPISK